MADTNVSTGNAFSFLSVIEKKSSTDFVGRSFADAARETPRSGVAILHSVLMTADGVL